VRPFNEWQLTEKTDSKSERHERRARDIEASRKLTERMEELYLQSLLLTPLDLEIRQDNVHVGFGYAIKQYVTGDVPLHLKGSTGMFKYGRKLYDLSKFAQIVKVMHNVNIHCFDFNLCSMYLKQVAQNKYFS